MFPITYSACKEQSGAVCSRIVCQPDLDAIARKFVSICRTNDHVSLNSGVRYLTGDVLVGESDNHPVLGSVVLIFVLDTETFSGIVVGFAFAPPPELDLVTLEVSLVLHYFYESRLQKIRK